MKLIESKGTVMDGAIGTCYGCDNRVILGLTARGAMLPLDLEPTQAGSLAVSVPAAGRAPQVRYLRGEDTQLATGEQRMTAHWDTHPACKGDRKGRKHAPEHDHKQADGRPAPPRPESRQGVMGKRSRRATAPERSAAAQEGASILGAPARRDMTLADLTLDQLATADLGAILGRRGGPGGCPGHAHRQAGNQVWLVHLNSLEASQRWDTSTPVPAGTSASADRWEKSGRRTESAGHAAGRAPRKGSPAAHAAAAD